MKKALSWALAIAMVFSLFAVMPVTASAYDPNVCNDNDTPDWDIALEVGSGGKVELTGVGELNVTGTDCGVYVIDGGVVNVDG